MYDPITWFVALPIGLGVVYLVVRVASLAFFRTKMGYQRKFLKDLEPVGGSEHDSENQ